MRNGDAEFQETMDKAERAVRQMAACGLSYSAKAVQDILRYTRALDKNQKALIKTLLSLQRENTMLVDIASKMMTYLTPAQKKHIKEYAEELKKNDTTRINRDAD